ncbi:hypothetical protein HDK64DRAFT_62304 [Phyllosticta capitalensis]
MGGGLYPCFFCFFPTSYVPCHTPLPPFIFSHLRLSLSGGISHRHVIHLITIFPFSFPDGLLMAATSPALPHFLDSVYASPRLAPVHPETARRRGSALIICSFVLGVCASIGFVSGPAPAFFESATYLASAFVGRTLAVRDALVRTSDSATWPAPRLLLLFLYALFYYCCHIL